MIYELKNNDPLLKYLERTEETKLEQIQMIEKYKNNDIIITLGDRNRDILIIYKGNTSVLILNEAGEEFKVAEIPAGEIIGEQNFVIPVRRTANVRAVDDVMVCRYPYNRLTNLLRNEPLIAAKIFAAVNDAIADRITKTIEMYINKNTDSLKK
jgi:CRP-like cAMP-binding protein